MAIELTVPTSNVYPSAGAFATNPVPMLPPAPDLFSTTNATPNFACRCCCRMRASKSAEPPAANGTMMVTGRCGQASCACAAAAKTRAAARAGANIRRMPTFRSEAQINRTLHRLQMRIAPLIKVLVGIAHGLWLSPPEHDLEIDRLEAVVLVAVDDARGA